MNGNENVRKHNAWFIALGAALIILGAIGLTAVVTTTLFSVIFFGWLLLIGGAVQMGHAFRVRPWSGLLLQLFVGILNIVVGLLIIANPGSSALALTLLMASFFIVGGIFRVVMAVPEHLPGRGWAILSGLINVLLGVLIWVQWPASGFWVIGLFIAVDLLFTGWWFVALGLAARRVIVAVT